MVVTAHFFAFFFSFSFAFSCGGFAIGVGGVCAAADCAARGEAALSDQVHGAGDGDADGAGVFVDVVVGAEGFFFFEADAVELAALVGFESGIGERALRIIARDAAGVGGGVGDQRVDGSLFGFGALVEEVVEAVDHEVGEHASDGQAHEEIEDAARADVAALVAAVGGGRCGMFFVGHESAFGSWLLALGFWLLAFGSSFLLCSCLLILLVSMFMRFPDDDVRAPALRWRTGRRPGAGAKSRGCGRSRRARNRRWRWARLCLPE